jgi:phage major head subunit gpT-like protein
MSGNLFQIANQFNLEAARVGFHVAFMQALEATGPDEVEALYQMVSSTTSLEEHQWIGDVPGFEKWVGDRNLGDFEAFKLRIVNEDWSSGMRAHQNQFKDDKLGLFPIAIQQLAVKARRHRADLCVKGLLNGFDGNLYPEAGNGLAYDGALFFSTAHANGSNKLTDALSATSLALAERMFGEMTTADGKDPLDIEGTTLIVGPRLRETAMKLTMNEFVPSAAGTATESNIHRGRYKVMVSRRIKGNQSNWWFLAALGQPIKPFIFQLREEISTSAIMGGQGSPNDSVPRFRKGELWFGAEARYNVAPFAFQTAIGSKVAP